MHSAFICLQNTLLKNALDIDALKRKGREKRGNGGFHLSIKFVFHSSAQKYSQCGLQPLERNSITITIIKTGCKRTCVQTPAESLSEPRKCAQSPAEHKLDVILGASLWQFLAVRKVYSRVISSCHLQNSLWIKLLPSVMIEAPPGICLSCWIFFSLRSLRMGTGA